MSDDDLLPHILTLDLERLQELRYGENPHQRAAFYRLRSDPVAGLGSLTHLHGPALSFNNLLDLSAGLALLLEFDRPAAVAMKHANPCGVALSETIGDAMRKAKDSDPVSIFGGVVGDNRPVDLEVVDALAGLFIEVLFAPNYDPGALERLIRTRRRMRVLSLPTSADSLPHPIFEFRSVLGGLLVQQWNFRTLNDTQLSIASHRAPTAAEWDALRLAWRIVKHAKSNAIALIRGDQLVGLGAGQPNRVDAARIAVTRAQNLGLDTAGTVCASDAFFPFRDGLDVVAAAGVTAVIQPAGAMHQVEIVDAANEHDIAMVTTDIRHFRH